MKTFLFLEYTVCLNKHCFVVIETIFQSISVQPWSVYIWFIFWPKCTTVEEFTFFGLIKPALFRSKQWEWHQQSYLIQYMACFKQLGHFELFRDRMLYHFSEAPQQQQATWEMNEDDFSRGAFCNSDLQLFHWTLWNCSHLKKAIVFR